jgi:2-keto-4-pentenoate hydratase/2-oxohepta-3-ene-1,7-dioic acid hydratase in catechol pathway
LVSPKVFEEQVKTIETRVNGRTTQKSPLDFIFPVNELVSFLSQGESLGLFCHSRSLLGWTTGARGAERLTRYQTGTTIPAGTAIMTGTPSGVGWFQDPQYSLKDGDVVEVEVQPIGILRNKMCFVN